MKKEWIAALVAAAVIVIFSVVAIRHHMHASTPIVVDGTIECDEISVSSKIPGRIEKLLVDEGVPPNRLAATGFGEAKNR